MRIKIIPTLNVVQKSVTDWNECDPYIEPCTVSYRKLVREAKTMPGTTLNETEHWYIK